MSPALVAANVAAPSSRPAASTGLPTIHSCETSCRLSRNRGQGLVQGETAISRLDLGHDGQVQGESRATIRACAVDKSAMLLLIAASEVRSDHAPLRPKVTLSGVTSSNSRCGVPSPTSDVPLGNVKVGTTAPKPLGGSVVGIPDARHRFRGAAKPPAPYSIPVPSAVVSSAALSSMTLTERISDRPRSRVSMLACESMIGDSPWRDLVSMPGVITASVSAC